MSDEGALQAIYFTKQDLQWKRHRFWSIISRSPYVRDQTGGGNENIIFGIQEHIEEKSPLDV